LSIGQSASVNTVRTFTMTLFDNRLGAHHSILRSLTEKLFQPLVIRLNNNRLITSFDVIYASAETRK